MSTKADFIERFQKIGNERFYRFLLAYAIEKLVMIETGNTKITSPETEFLDYAEKFLQLYRREGLPTYLELSKTLRKAGHKIYRLMLKKGLINKNCRFLQVV
jgi:hypothetical protein